MLALWSSSLAFAAQSPAEQKGVQLFNQSEASYRAGRFREAADLLRQAYDLLRSPTLLYNLARALESDGDLKGALAAYRQYLRDEPKIPDRPAIESRVANLERQLKERESLEADRAAAEKARLEAEARLQQSVTVVAAPAPEVKRPSAVPWVVAAVGAVAVGAGGVFGGLAQGRQSSALGERTQLRADQLNAEARGLALAANVLYGVGAAVALLGVIWGIVDVARSGPRLAPASDGAGVALVGAF